MPSAHAAPAALPRAVARRLTEAHRGLADASLLAFGSASSLESNTATPPELNLSLVFQALPSEGVLADACGHAAGSPWFGRQGASADGRLVVGCRIDGIEVQINYLDRPALNRALHDSLAECEGGAAPQSFRDNLLKAEPLAGHAELARLQARLTRLPPQLACAMVKRFLATPIPWRAISQLGNHYEMRRCRELQADACYRLCAVRAALGQRFFTRFQVKRTHGLSPQFEDAPPSLAEKIARLMEAAPRSAFAQLYALEGEVLAQVARDMPQVNLAAVQAQRAAYAPA